MAKKKENQEFQKELVKQLATLSASAFGLVAALAWNTAIQKLINTYVNKFIPTGNGVVAAIIYAIIITLIAVLVTYQLSKFAKNYSEK